MLTDSISKILGEDRVLKNEPMAKHTTFRIGGPADFFYEAQTTAELVNAVALCKKEQVPYFVLAGGSKILVGDHGIRGLVIHNKTAGFTVLDQGTVVLSHWLQTRTQPRFEPADPNAFIEFGDLDYDESTLPPVQVKVSSGTMMPVLINELLAQGITGLEWFVRIPASVGGGIFINMHGANRFLGDKVIEAQVLTAAGETKTVGRDYFQFDYDKSVLQENSAILIDVTLVLYRGDAKRAKNIAVEWAKRKSKVQTPVSAGSVFRNLSADDQKRLLLPTPAAGFVIDKLLGLKGKQIGMAQISPKHANFIVNLSAAKARDVVELVKLVKNMAKEKLGLELVEELIYVGEF